MIARTAISIALAAALALGACGGEDASPANPDEPATQAYIAEANARCAELPATIEERAADYDLGTDEGFQSFVDEVAIPELEGMFAELRSLEPPEGDAETLERIYDEYDAAIDEARQGLDQVEEGLYDDANELALEYGLEECVQQA